MRSRRLSSPNIGTVSPIDINGLGVHQQSPCELIPSAKERRDARAESCQLFVRGALPGPESDSGAEDGVSGPTQLAGRPPPPPWRGINT